MTETAGVRESRRATSAATRDQAQIDAMVATAGRRLGLRLRQRARPAGRRRSPSLRKRSRPGQGVSAAEAAGAAQAAGPAGARRAASAPSVGTAQKAGPEAGKEQLAAELALGPQIAGGSWRTAAVGDVDAEQRVNVRGRTGWLRRPAAPTCRGRSASSIRRK